jgi:hypothetical protein
MILVELAKVLLARKRFFVFEKMKRDLFDGVALFLIKLMCGHAEERSIRVFANSDLKMESGSLPPVHTHSLGYRWLFRADLGTSEG